jgi:hypothetical protein
MSNNESENKNFVAGGFGGACLVIIGHLPDTIKVSFTIYYTGYPKSLVPISFLNISTISLNFIKKFCFQIIGGYTEFYLSERPSILLCKTIMFNLIYKNFAFSRIN